MERDRYSPNWHLIGLAIKEGSLWRCQQCDRPCRQPGESIAQLEERLEPRWFSELIEVIADDELEKIMIYRPQRFLLTVAHLDQNPGNNEPGNLKALCAPCHLRHDRRFLGFNRRQKLERQGQLNLFAEQCGGAPG